ncbi:uncharacterized protein LOC143182767 [Calliopsis andreniformis]|uniref:uncharacterized protein LOC143182767 n=1 Tax=Calliopsis andreniformis TaxID=337506 RepID=UPI003FCD9B64
MFHRPECQRYRQWKREQAKKSKDAKKKVKKEKRKEPVTDCIDEEEEAHVKEASLKVESRKCKKKQEKVKRRRPKLLIGAPVKRVTLAELLVRKIQPPIEVRHRILNARHIPCLYHTGVATDGGWDGQKRTRTSSPRHTHVIRYPPRIPKKRKRAARKPTKGEKKAKGMKEKTEDEASDESKTAASDKGTAEAKVKGERKRKRLKRRKVDRKTESESESEDSECDSICSFDSEVYLAGLKLTPDDKKKLKKYQRQNQEASGEEQA